MAEIETPTKIKIISDALISLGEKPLNTLTDDRYGATVGSNLFERMYENELTGHLWRFAINKKLLSQLVAAPLNEWDKAYQLPSDLLMPVRVYPNTNYEIYGNKLFANVNAVELDYVFKPDISQVPAYFYELMVTYLAWKMAKPITGSDQLLQLKRDEYREQRNRALWADSQGRPNRAFDDNPFVDVR